MTLEFVVITTGRFGNMERTLIITEALHVKVACFFGYSWYFRIPHINFSVKPILITPNVNYYQYCHLLHGMIDFTEVPKNLGRYMWE